MISFTLTQLTYFVATVTTGSTAGAARCLNVAQPSVSMAITKLERQLEVQLFLRHPVGGLILTPAGKELFVEARNLLDQAKDLAERTKGSIDALYGTLQIGCYLTIAPYFMPEIIGRFSDQHPRVDLQIREGEQSELLRGLDRGDFPLALLYDVDLPNSVYRESLKELPSYVLLPSDHCLARRKSISLRELAGEPFILFDVAPSRDFFLAMLLRAGIEPEIRFRSPSFEMVRGLVGQGLGYSVLATRPHGDTTYDGREISCVPLSGINGTSTLAIARLDAVRPTSLMSAFWNFSRSFFEERL